jgi:hypothetical protein
MPVGEEDQGPIARIVAAHLPRGLQELLHYVIRVTDIGCS